MHAMLAWFMKLMILAKWAHETQVQNVYLRDDDPKSLCTLLLSRNDLIQVLDLKFLSTHLWWDIITTKIYTFTAPILLYKENQ